MLDEAPGIYDELARSLREIPTQLSLVPKAILVVTAHWVEREFVISSHPHPAMIYDYGGFPEKYYHVQYKAPGSPELAARAHDLLNAANLPTRLDPERGFDHGTYTVVQPMFPNANVPVVQLSIHRKFDPETHMRAGQALAPLRREGILIVGSGLSYHNLGAFGSSARVVSREFDRWLQHAMGCPARERKEQLCAWNQAPSSRKAHPREDHLLPLHVALGAAEAEPATVIYHEDDFFGGVCVSSFRFG
jgi:aromatic ring-opening dioxygenase catalytic subunit (LigB family)